VAVLPFEATVQDKAIGDKVQKIFMIELLTLGAFEVVEPGLVVKTLRANRVESVDALAPADLKKLGAELGCQGFFIGTVVDYGESHSGTTAAPDVTIQLRLVETQAGVTVWSSSQTQAGPTFVSRLFGVGNDSPTEAAQRLIRRELATLIK
jgi:hypothetical protein